MIEFDTKGEFGHRDGTVPLAARAGIACSKHVRTERNLASEVVA